MLQLKDSISVETYKFHQQTILCQIQIKPRTVQYYKHAAPKILHRWFDGSTNWERFEAELHRILDKQDWNNIKLDGEFCVNPLIRVKYKSSPELIKNCLWYLKISNILREDIALALECSIEYNEDCSCLCAHHEINMKTKIGNRRNHVSAFSPMIVTEQSSDNADVSFFSQTSSSGNIVTSPCQENREMDVEHQQKLQTKEKENGNAMSSGSDYDPSTKTSTERDHKNDFVSKRRKTSRHTKKEDRSGTNDEIRKENRSRSRDKIGRFRNLRRFDSKEKRIEKQKRQDCNEEQKIDKLRKCQASSHSQSLSPFEKTSPETGIMKQTTKTKPEHDRLDSPMPISSSQASDDEKFRRSKRTLLNTKRFLNFKADDYNKKPKIKDNKDLNNLFGSDDEDDAHFVVEAKSRTNAKKTESEPKVKKLNSRAESEKVPLDKILETQRSCKKPSRTVGCSKSDPKDARIEDRSDSLNSDELDRLESERLDNLCAQLLLIPNMPKPPKVDILSLQDMTLDKVLDTFDVYKSEIEEVMKDLRAKSNVNQYKGLSHLHVINLLNEDTQLKMMAKVAETYNMAPSGKTTSLLLNAVVPTWTAHLFMDRYKMTHQEAVKHIIAQQDYGDYLKYEKEKTNDSL